MCTSVFGRMRVLCTVSVQAAEIEDHSLDNEVRSVKRMKRTVVLPFCVRIVRAHNIVRAALQHYVWLQPRNSCPKTTGSAKCPTH